ncbi:MAG TPA: phage tail protein [Thermoanaerobaculia bacterium]|jgi:phage tail-like protein|nr:phage tail protein [Thermoanaerobaculia bacterium]
MSPISTTRLSRYLDDLPALYRTPARGGRPDFLGRFLLAFEQVLTGVGDVDKPGLEERLDGITDDAGNLLRAGSHRYFEPGPDLPEGERAPAEFLDWLSSWVALTMRGDWTDGERRRILAEIVPSYRRRGTRDGLQRILSAFTGLSIESITISELLSPMQLGVSATVGKDTVVGGSAPHYFLVDALVPASDVADLSRKKSILRAILDLEKPAHTFYDLRIQVPTMQVGVTSRVGVETVLGGVIE